MVIVSTMYNNTYNAAIEKFYLGLPLPLILYFYRKNCKLEAGKCEAIRCNERYH